ncbi:MAG: sigma-70 family RNA polymerase sigma factor [Anaerolineae bacterium]|nr:sigma-70 family RNA polymerase sigma factor [Anaerolineae bacterium]
MDDRDLPTLVIAAQAGDDPAFAELVGRFQTMAYGYAYSLLGNFHAAQDAAQEAFVEAYRCLGQLDVPVAFPSWLKRIVLKHCDREMRRKALPIVPLEDAVDVAASAPGPEAVMEQRGLQSEVFSALDGLSADLRAVTTLYYIDGYGQGEIAAFLDVPPSTVKSRIHTARQQLRQRMMEMVREALQSNALPDGFAEETLSRAVAEAAAANKAHRFSEAESLLRNVLAKTPDVAPALRTAALRELNRTLMWGQYDSAFDRRYEELITNAQAILAAGVPGEDEPVWRDLAQTLLYIPRMADAVAHLEAWIARKGPNPVRLGMLAWARGCTGDYEGALAGWSRFLEITTRSVIGAGHHAISDAANRIQVVCMTMVDCLGAAGRVRQDPALGEAAIGIAHEGRAAAHTLASDLPQLTEDGGLWIDPWPWVGIYLDAGLDWEGLARSLVDELPDGDSLPLVGGALGLRTFYDEPEDLFGDWKAWVETCVSRHAWRDLEVMRSRVRGFIACRRPRALYTAAAIAIDALRPVADGSTDAAHRAQRAQRAWGWVRYDVFAAIHSHDLELAQEIAREGAEALGIAEGGSSLVIAAMAAGAPTPPDVLALIEREGPRAIDPAGMFGWYALGREAAAAGDSERALDYLSRALEGWCNPPLSYVEQWEADTRWGALREDARWKALFAAKRAAIGPVYGQLHYFPGW